MRDSDSLSIPLSEWEHPIVSGQHSVENVEAKNLSPDDGRVPHVPFGFMNSRWIEFKTSFRTGDEIMLYSSNEKDWERGMGREGYILVRNQIIIDEIMTKMN